MEFPHIMIRVFQRSGLTEIWISHFRLEGNILDKCSGINTFLSKLHTVSSHWWQQSSSCYAMMDQISPLVGESACLSVYWNLIKPQRVYFATPLTARRFHFHNTIIILHAHIGVFYLWVIQRFITIQLKFLLDIALNKCYWIWFIHS